MFRYFFALLLLSHVTFGAQAQDAAYLPYFSSDTTQVYQLAVAHRNAIRAHFGPPKTGNSEYREHYRRIVQQASTEVYNSIRYSALLDPVLDASVQRVFRQILQANPQLATTKLVLTRNPEANAYAVGNGTIILNIGLLPSLENESQLAFILCHELAHVQCRHMETGIQERLSTIHSREMRRQVRRIVQAEYNINSKMKALVMGLSLDGTYHQRRHERQADSLGYVLLKRTAYEAPQAYRALQLLDQMDEPASKDPLEMSRYFSCADFAKVFETVPPKPQSIFAVKAAEKTVLETTDTLKSHPDCAKRMRYIRELAQGQVAEGVQPMAPEFARLRALSRLEVVQSWFDTDCYDHALFDALLLLRDDPQNAYLRSVVQLSLFELRKHLIDHRFTEVVSNLSAHNPANFNQLLNTLYGLRNADYKGLSTCFAQQQPAPSTADEYALAARYAAAALADDQAQTTVLQQQYLAQYKSGRFAALLFPTPVSSVKRK
ncbi:M48 family metalloprotease [Hymenobacter sediminicola]|uniref:M48 family metalloprotease n=1 Tax=Hymenobacter sediminicola TaxID=2761579 RepID=A0A7G7WAQ9_9BACT|nr:M48 family metalloprotease [Hymenobacter sediminicola]QNH63452.1 M48 family metalloprotease [Hymenobacter sediminicola]